MADLTYSTGSAAQFAETILGDGVTVNSATLIGGADQYRIFSGGNTNAPDLTQGNEGVVFSTGTADRFNDDDANNNQVSASFGNPGDADLDAISTGTTGDASGIEINFTANFTGQVQFVLTFGSEEFPDYLNTQFNDIAAVFLDGAVVPIPNTTNGYFDVNTITDTGFTDNTGATAPFQDQTDFNGLLTERLVSIDVVNGQTYTIKIAVADVADTSFDSTVLLSAICFCAGTPILTPTGPCAVEDLSVGREVVTRDGGTKPIGWIGMSEVFARGELAPVHFSKGAIGNSDAFEVSPNHKVLIDDWRALLMTGAAEVLVPAKELVNGDTIVRLRRNHVRYFHILLDDHDLLQSNGIWTESFFPGREALRALAPETRQELEEQFPDLVAAAAAGQVCRGSAKSFEARALAAVQP
ncbi:MAG: Hint domain-containing protein [Pseudomonadota bacterium]